MAAYNAPPEQRNMGRAQRGVVSVLLREGDGA